MDLQEFDLIDVLAFTTEKLEVRYKKAQNQTEETKIVQDFLRRWDADPTLKQLKQRMKIELNKDLDWFNVSEAISIEKLKGKIVILEFFTYCCINCMHVLPDLRNLEELFPIERGLVVIGVHSPKFENEKSAVNISLAAQRYNITHPIVNDPRSTLWRSIGIRCWPSLLVLSPRGEPMVLLMGEGHVDFLKCFIQQSLQYFERAGLIENFSLPISLLSSSVASKLKFPVKIARNDVGNFAIADAGNNRILIFNSDGVVQHKIGSGTAGFIDGNFSNAQFNTPQGVTFLDQDTLIVADTNNHSIRQIKISTCSVETLVGTGQQGNDRNGGKIGLEQTISSPWDVVVFRIKDMDLSFYADEDNVPEKTIILIAMAGTHQIWGYFPDGMIWWKFRIFEPLTCASLVGNGLEQNRNNLYPQNAAFAQPSGLAIAKNFLFIADSESSSIRKVSLLDGKGSAVVGGDCNPLNLFAYGDVDGKEYDAKLQHPLGLAYNHINNKIYVADSYNHKIKVIDPTTNSIETVAIKDEHGKLYKFNEPASLCFDLNAQNLLVADTNNHIIKIVDMTTLTAKTLMLDFNEVNFISVIDAPQNPGIQQKQFLPLNNCQRLKLHVNLELSDDLKYAQEAKQTWSLETVNSPLKTENSYGLVHNGTFTICLERESTETLVPIDATEMVLTVSLNLCDSTKCLMKKFTILFSDNSTLGDWNDEVEKAVNIIVT